MWIPHHAPRTQWQKLLYCNQHAPERCDHRLGNVARKASRRSPEFESDDSLPCQPQRCHPRHALVGARTSLWVMPEVDATSCHMRTRRKTLPYYNQHALEQRDCRLGMLPETRHVILQNSSLMTHHRDSHNNATLGTPLWERAQPSG